MAALVFERMSQYAKIAEVIGDFLFMFDDVPPLNTVVHRNTCIHQRFPVTFFILYFGDFAMNIVTRTMRQLLVAVLCIMIGSSALAEERETLRLATTTSTENSGLLAVLLPVFEKKYGMKVYTIAVGTGKALRLGENGDVDVVMVHAKAAEEVFISKGYGVEREEFMYNYFLLVGPQSDPADTQQAASAPQALQKIHETQSLFVSRGDDSGTHKREQIIWSMAKLKPAGSWYREAGQGMGKVLQIAGELQAYTLTDRGTWLKLGKQSGLVELYSASPPLYNPYSVIAVSPKRYPSINNKGANTLIDWLKSPQGQTLIDNYRIEGERAFVPLHPVLSKLQRIEQRPTSA